MSHDRGCFRCNEDPSEYRACRIVDCPKKGLVVEWDRTKNMNELSGYGITARDNLATKRIDMPKISTARQPILNLSWQTIHEGVDILAHMIKPIKPHLIVGISRGGLIPATLLSHKLDCPLEVIHASSYTGSQRMQRPVMVDGWKKEYEHSKVVIIDDIMDTGNTWDAILYGDGRVGSDFKTTFFTLAKKDKARFINFTNYFLQVPSDVWVKFPWEQDA